MRKVGIVMIGVFLLAAMIAAIGGVPAQTVNAAPGAQRATSTPTAARITATATPTATLSVARILLVTPLAPLTTTTVLTTAGLTTTVLMPVQIVTASTYLSGTASVTPTITATPRTTSRPTTRATATPTPTPAPTGIVDFRAVASRLRGRVDLSWGYKGDTFDGSFLVERSTNGSVWRFVKDCIQPFAADAATYKCSDVDLTSGTAYSYRACVVNYGTACASTDATDPVTVKAP